MHWKLLPILVSSGLVVLTTALVAQPVRLTPGASGERTPGAESAAPPRGESGRREADDQPVGVGTLDPIDPSTAGALAEWQGGFANTLWRGMTRERFEALLPRLPSPSPSPTVRSLTRRLLLSPAALPEGAGKAPSVLGLRVERLYTAGLADDALALARLAPPGFRDPAIDRVVTDLSFTSGDNQGGCGRVDQAIAAGATGSFWLKRLAFCRTLLGERDAARLATELLREMGEKDDEQFFALIALLLGDSSNRPTTFGDLSALHLAMLRAARLEVPDGAVTTTSPSVLQALASAANASPEVRLAAGQSAESLGLVTSEVYGQLLRNLPVRAEELANPKSVEPVSIGRRNALLHRVVGAQTIAAAQAEAIRDALTASRATKTYASVARALKEPLAAMSPEADLAWFSGEAALALITAGDFAAARRWFELARANVSAAQPEAARAVIDLWPLFQLGDRERPLAWDPATLKSWYQGLAVYPPEKRRQRAELVVAAFDSLGQDVDPPAWLSIVEGTAPSVPASAILLRALRASAEAGRLGETVVLALVALGEGGPPQVSPVTLDAVVRALRNVGLANEAQAIAFEAVLGQTQY